MDSLPRRAVLGALALAGVGTAVSVAVRPRPARAPAPLFTPGRVLRSQPRKEYAQKLAAEVARYLAPTPDHPRHPWYPGAVVLTALRGDILAHEAVGEAVRYGPGAVELPAALRVPAATDTIYDLASLTKLFTTVLALRLVDHGELDLARPVSWYLPAFSGKPEATVAMLLTHTAGLPGDMDLKPLPDRDSRIAAVLAAPPLSAPGTQFRYSDLGFITLGVLVERLAGTRLDDLVAAQITGPLGMRDTGFAPLTAAWARVAATEYMPWTGRGVVRGQVHDEAAWTLGGVAGHAGLFGTAFDVAILGQMLANGGEYAGVRLLRERTVTRMLANWNGALGPAAAHGLGVALDQPRPPRPPVGDHLPAPAYRRRQPRRRLEIARLGSPRALLALRLRPAERLLVQLLGQPGQLRTQEVPGGHLAQGDPQRRDLPGQVLGVGLLHCRAPPVLLHRQAVPVGLAVLRQQDQRCGVGGLQGQDQGQEREGVRVEAPFPRCERVPAEPQHDHHGHVDEEPRRAHEPGEPLRPPAKGLRVEAGQLDAARLAGLVQPAVPALLSHCRARSSSGPRHPGPASAPAAGGQAGHPR